MADESQESTEESNGGAEDAGAVQTPLTIGAQYIKDLSFENPLGPEALATMNEAPSIDLEINPSAQALQGDIYEVTLFIRGEAKNGETSVFIVELTYCGIITLNGMTEADIQPVLLIEGARHLFPFARAIIADVTRNGGYPPLLINPMDFASAYIEKYGLPEGFTAG